MLICQDKTLILGGTGYLNGLVSRRNLWTNVVQHSIFYDCSPYVSLLRLGGAEKTYELSNWLIMTVFLEQPLIFLESAIHYIFDMVYMPFHHKTTLHSHLYIPTLAYITRYKQHSRVEQVFLSMTNKKLIYSTMSLVQSEFSENVNILVNSVLSTCMKYQQWNTHILYLTKHVTNHKSLFGYIYTYNIRSFFLQLTHMTRGNTKMFL